MISTKLRFKARTKEWKAAKSKSTSLSHMTCLGAGGGAAAGQPGGTPGLPQATPDTWMFQKLVIKRLVSGL